MARTAELSEQSICNQRLAMGTRPEVALERCQQPQTPSGSAFGSQAIDRTAVSPAKTPRNAHRRVVGAVRVVAVVWAMLGRNRAHKRPGCALERPYRTRQAPRRLPAVQPCQAPQPCSPTGTTGATTGTLAPCPSARPAHRCQSRRRPCSLPERRPKVRTRHARSPLAAWKRTGRALAAVGRPRRLPVGRKIRHREAPEVAPAQPML